jgi:hypothetical protein
MKVFENHPHDATLRYTFSMVRQSYFASQLSGIDYIDLRILFNCVDHRLAAFVAGSEANVAACTLVVAAQIYVQCVMRSSEAGCLLPSLLSLRLVELLRVRLEELLATAEYWNGILWVLTIGMVFTLPYSVEWSFFVSKLLYVTKIAGIVDMVQLEMIVQRFVWDSSQPQLMELLQTNEPFVFGGKTWDELTHSVPSHDFLI